MLLFQDVAPLQGADSTNLFDAEKLRCMAYELAASSRRGPMGQSEQVKPLVAWALNAAQVAEKSRSQRSDYGLGGRSSGIKKKRKPGLFPFATKTF